MAEETFSVKVKEEYLEQTRKFQGARPAHCPYCKNDGSLEDEGLTWEFDGFIGSDEIRVRVQCEKCEKYWYEYYTLQDIEPGSPVEEDEAA